MGNVNCFIVIVKKKEIRTYQTLKKSSNVCVWVGVGWSGKRYSTLKIVFLNGILLPLLTPFVFASFPNRWFSGSELVFSCCTVLNN